MPEPIAHAKVVRYPVAALRRVAVGAQARVAGRLTACEPGRALLADATGSLELTFDEPAPAIGSWVVANGAWTGSELAAVRFERGAEPLRAFPAPGGEWLWLHEDGGRRLRALTERAAIRAAARAWFEERTFLEVETPMAVRSPGLDLHLAAVRAAGLGEERWLITSPEYHMKRLLAGGLPRIFQLARCFRRHERGGMHEPEFTMLEWYRAFSGSEAILRDTEHLVASVAEAVRGSTTIPARGRSVDVRPPWKRMTVEEAFSRIAGVALDDVLPDHTRFFRILVEQIEPGLGYPKPVFLTRWPASMASLARLCPDDPRRADRVEAYVDGLELCNGFGELIDPIEQRARLEHDQKERRARGLDDYPVDERFLGALEEGLPRCAGNALGFDRLVMLVTGMEHIEDVMAFPQSRV